eukprot:gnl/TRDRNA2_/TRDRNA2_73184_c0_seq1.p1 gnl/TRDRNA2_/TRDRNA2_73184_c0~~gnl/TRDRNA2_/TRDRNA2_73184_c0_seq1.p1  ORF type:complete len:453 (-),score=92.64 gnl/TRDRNA2_/TRDRNA2_73184_c0_seq1:52-1356(-)
MSAFAAAFVLLLALADCLRTLRSSASAARTSTAGGVLRGATVREKQDEQIEEWADSGHAIESLLNKEELQNLAAGITEDSYSRELHDFCSSASDGHGPEGTYTTRYVPSHGNILAAAYIKRKLKELGLEAWSQEVQLPMWLRIQAILHNMGVRENVLARIDGSDLKHEVVVIGAHFDGVNWKLSEYMGAKLGAPGVDDNGSGTAAVLQIAKALAHHKPRRTILFAFFNGEEENLLGSKVFAEKASAGEFGDVKAALILDEVAWPGRGGSQSPANAAIFETVGTVPGTSALLDTMGHLYKTAGDGISGFNVNKHGFGSDHISLLDKKIPAVLLIERDDIYHADSWGHSSQDTFQHVSLAFGASMSRLALRTVASISSPKQAQADATALRTVASISSPKLPAPVVGAVAVTAQYNKTVTVTAQYNTTASGIHPATR